jgi:hypothetical protein
MINNIHKGKMTTENIRLEFNNKFSRKESEEDNQLMHTSGDIRLIISICMNINHTNHYLIILI